MWSATRITEDVAEKLQVNAGLLLNTFDITNPIEPSDTDIVCETTGDFAIRCVPTTEDFFADINNAVRGAKEGLRITAWDCGLDVTALSITEETLQLALGAYKTESNNGIRAKNQYAITDFKSLYWIGDLGTEDKLLVIVLEDALSTGGVSYSTTDRGKGRLALSIRAFPTVQSQEKVPMAFYILTKTE